MAQFHVLYESSSGYALFDIVSLDETTILDHATQRSIGDHATFSRSCKLRAFQPFTSAEEALANIQAISDHAIPDTLSVFLKNNLPKPGKKSTAKLGIIEPTLADCPHWAPTTIRARPTARSNPDRAGRDIRGYRIRGPLGRRGSRSNPRRPDALHAIRAGASRWRRGAVAARSRA